MKAYTKIVFHLAAVFLRHCHTTAEPAGVEVQVSMQRQQVTTGFSVKMKVFQAYWQCLPAAYAAHGTCYECMDCVEKNIATSRNGNR
jgi:hypothetical protein